MLSWVNFIFQCAHMIYYFTKVNPLLLCEFRKNSTGVIVLFTALIASEWKPKCSFLLFPHSQKLLQPFLLQGWTLFVKSNNLSLQAVLIDFEKQFAPLVWTCSSRKTRHWLQTVENTSMNFDFSYPFMSVGGKKQIELRWYHFPWKSAARIFLLWWYLAKLWWRKMTWICFSFTLRGAKQ